jgi:hypothetical protein
MIHQGREIFLVCQDTNLRAIVNQDGAAILDLVSDRISTLNSTGAIVWQALERGDDIETIAQNLAQLTGEKIDQVRKDVAEFVEALNKQKLSPR